MSMGSTTPPKSGFVPGCAVVLMAALLSGCTVSEAPPPPAARFEWTVLTQEPVMGNARTGIVTDRVTGCLYSFQHGAGVTPLVGPDGKQSGCRSTTANSVGMSEANAPTTPPVKTGGG